jgi:hypothetical protein
MAKDCPRSPDSVDWENGAYRSAGDTALLLAMRDCGMILVRFDRASMPHHAGTLTRKGVGHAGVILFRRSVRPTAYGQQARLLIGRWEEAVRWDWDDRIEYLPRS